MELLKASTSRPGGLHLPR